MSECNHNCANCNADCTSRKESFLEKPNELSNIKKVIGVVSGKGGVGKSLITSLLAVEMQRKGYKTAILDADITGPSIPKSFGINERATADENGIYPSQSKMGTKIMSINLLLENETEPVVWRGPVIAGAVKQFWTDVIWKDIDFMFVDMPPGTGDVPLTVFQSLPVNGIVIVTSPQELVEMIVGKAVKMAELCNIPIIALVENMSYFVCPNCKEKHYIYGKSNIEEFAKNYGINVISKLPIDPNISKLCDNGNIEDYREEYLNSIVSKIEKL